MESRNKIIAIFPGSFNPPTKGHLDIIKKASKMFDKVIWAAGTNPRKTQEMFKDSECFDMMEGCVKGFKNVEVARFKGALVDFARNRKALVIIRSFRTIMDMSFADQALVCEWLVKNHSKLEPLVYDVPKEIDKKVARLKLKSMGIEIDKLTSEQAKYLKSWKEGT